MISRGQTCAVFLGLLGVWHGLTNLIRIAATADGLPALWANSGTWTYVVWTFGLQPLTVGLLLFGRRRLVGWILGPASAVAAGGRDLVVAGWLCMGVDLGFRGIDVFAQRLIDLSLAHGARACAGHIIASAILLASVRLVARPRRT